MKLMPTDFEFSEVLIEMLDGEVVPMCRVQDIAGISTDATSGRGDTAGIAA